MKHPIIVRSCLALGFASIILFAGCLMSKVALIDPAAAKVNLAFVGDWDNPEQFDSSGREAGLVIRNIDNKLYYVEWREKGEKDLVRAVGCITDVKGATFVQMRGLEAKGDVPDEWLISRLDLDGSRLTIRQLKSDFFKDRKIETSAALRQVLEQNLDNEAMYDKSETRTATKK